MLNGSLAGSSRPSRLTRISHPRVPCEMLDNAGRSGTQQSPGPQGVLPRTPSTGWRRETCSGPVDQAFPPSSWEEAQPLPHPDDAPSARSLQPPAWNWVLPDPGSPALLYLHPIPRDTFLKGVWNPPTGTQCPCSSCASVYSPGAGKAEISGPFTRALPSAPSLSDWIPRSQNIFPPWGTFALDVLSPRMSSSTQFCRLAQLQGDPFMTISVISALRI